MPHLIEVAFRGNRNEFFLWESDPPPPLRAAVIVDADRGEDLPAAEAAPLLCAGITVFNALRNSGAKPGDIVAVQGVGGLGHLGIQYAQRMGFVTVALIAFLLLRLAHDANRIVTSPLAFARLLRTNLMHRRAIAELSARSQELRSLTYGNARAIETRP